MEMGYQQRAHLAPGCFHVLGKMNTAMTGKHDAADDQIDRGDRIGERLGLFHAVGRQHRIAVLRQNLAGRMVKKRIHK